MSFSIVNANIIKITDNSFARNITLTVEKGRVTTLANSVLPDLTSPIYDGRNFVFALCDIEKWKINKSDESLAVFLSLISSSPKDIQEVINVYPIELPQYITLLRERNIKIFKVDFPADFFVFHLVEVDISSLFNSPSAVCVDGLFKYGGLPQVSGHWTLSIFMETHIPD